MTPTVLCRLNDIEDGGSAGFTVERPWQQAGKQVGEQAEKHPWDEPLLLLAVRRGEQVFVYENCCPHWGSPLDIVPGRFLDPTGERILCTTHGAIFRIEDGLCLKGPCLGAHLRPADVEVRDGTVVLLRVPQPAFPGGL